MIYLSLVGKKGLVETAKLCAGNAAYARKKISELEHVDLTFNTSCFNEFAVTLPCKATELISQLIPDGIAAGFPVGKYYKGMKNVLLLAFTEKRTHEEIDRLVTALGKAV